LSALIASSAVLSLIGLDSEKIILAYKNITQQVMRPKIINVSNIRILDDSYSASPEAVIEGINTLCKYDGEKSCVLGDMLELGVYTEEMHKKIGRYAAEKGIEKLYLFGVYAPFTASGAIECGMKKENIFINTDPTTPMITAKQILENYTSGGIILFKASRKLKVERIYEEIEKLKKGV